MALFSFCTCAFPVDDLVLGACDSDRGRVLGFASSSCESSWRAFDEGLSVWRRGDGQSALALCLFCRNGSSTLVLSSSASRCSLSLAASSSPRPLLPGCTDRLSFARLPSSVWLTGAGAPEPTWKPLTPGTWRPAPVATSGPAPEAPPEPSWSVDGRSMVVGVLIGALLTAGTLAAVARWRSWKRKRAESATHEPLGTEMETIDDEDDNVVEEL